MKISDYLKENNLEAATFARSLTSPDITRWALAYRIKAGWTVEDKKGVGVIMRSPCDRCAIHQWRATDARKNRK